MVADRDWSKATTVRRARVESRQDHSSFLFPDGHTGPKCGGISFFLSFLLHISRILLLECETTAAVCGYTTMTHQRSADQPPTQGQKATAVGANVGASTTNGQTGAAWAKRRRKRRTDGRWRANEGCRSTYLVYLDVMSWKRTRGVAWEKTSEKGRQRAKQTDIENPIRPWLANDRNSVDVPRVSREEPWGASIIRHRIRYKWVVLLKMGQ
ncbi:hypothetical protein BJ166DRAFT_244206 [Pestalotiopsis sp. NC0098]|nr:hypothetical protein BJ166DRAFT_244206 [Pestalotiopsis sp. NC0098]